MPRYRDWVEITELVRNHLDEIVEYLDARDDNGNPDDKERKRRMKFCPMHNCDDCREWQYLAEALADEDV